MSEIFSLNDAYSTTRRVTKTHPRFDGVLLYPDRVRQGGLRSKGWFKLDDAVRPLITVVTVVYNGSAFIEDTIKSVLNQSYDNVEYIVVDGGSTDATLDIISKYNEKIDYWISEKDSGIYNAMNKALNISTGHYVIFLNADDYFFDDDVIRSVGFDRLKSEGVQIIYGKTCLKDDSTSWVVGEEVSFYKLPFYAICHQSVFVERNVYITCGLFDEQYKIVSDYDFFVKAFKKGVKSEFQNQIYSVMRDGGVSSLFVKKTVLEKLNMIKKHYQWNVYIKVYIKALIFTLPRFYVRMLLNRLGLLGFVRLIRKRLSNCYQ